MMWRAAEAAPSPAVATPPPASRQPPLWLLAMVTLSGTLAMHIFIPALPVAAADLQASDSALRATISLYILGLALGQLIYGPVADHFGRRATLLTGLALYTAAGLAAAFAPTAPSLILARLAQALGGCAGLVLGRAIVRDTAGPEQAARRLALMNLMVLLGPGLAPILGGMLATTLGWRAIFGALCALGLVLVLLTWRMLPETGQRGVNADLASLGRNYGKLIGSRAFLGFALGGGCATTSMYAFTASAPFIFSGQLHRPPEEVGVYLAILIGGAWVGSAMTGRLVARMRLQRLMVGANLLSLAAACVLLGAVLLGQLSVPLAVGSMFIFTMGAGATSPLALTQAVGVNPAVVGSAAGLFGFAQMAVGALCTSLAGFGPDPALTAALVLVGASIVAQLSFWLALRPIGGAPGAQTQPRA